MRKPSSYVATTQQLERALNWAALGLTVVLGALLAWWVL